MSTEEWRPVPGCPGYEVSDHGRVVSYLSGSRRVLKVSVSRHGYAYVGIRREAANGKIRAHASEVHRLVMLAFVGPRPEGQLVRHLDGDPLNARLTNLAYGTPRENNLDTTRHGRSYWANKTHCPKGHPYDEVNTYVAPTGGRRCVACIRKQARDFRRARAIA